MSLKNIKTSTWEKITIAAIPVIGGIIIAYITISPKDNKPVNPIVQSLPNAALKNKAGQISEMVAYNRYDDVYATMSGGLKQVLPKTLFNSVSDSIHKNLGDYIKPIDTTYSSAFGVENFYIKNQFQRGTNINTIALDKEGNLVALYCTIK